MRASGALVRFFSVGALLVAAACAGPRGNPFAAPPASPRGEGVTYYTVRFEVSCDTCANTWNAQGQQGRGREQGLWSHSATVGLRGTETTSAQVSAAPLSGPVSRIRIFVNGAVVADERRGMQDAGEKTLTARVIIPPRPAQHPNQRLN